MKEKIRQNIISNNDIGKVSMKIGGWNADLDVAEAKFSYCEYGKLFSYSQYYTIGGLLITDKSVISQYQDWEKAKWAEFATIANEKGIEEGMRQTCVR